MVQTLSAYTSAEGRVLHPLAANAIACPSPAAPIATRCCCSNIVETMSTHASVKERVLSPLARDRISLGAAGSGRHLLYDALLTDDQVCEGVG